MGRPSASRVPTRGFSMNNGSSEPIQEQLWIWYSLAAVAIAYFLGFGTGCTLRVRRGPT
jgi:hypothetical protein